MEKANQDENRSLLIFFIIFFLIGAYLRLHKVLLLNFPLNDGGLFYSMIQDIQSNHFRIPETTTYNHLDIPFVYPPLAFFLVGIINQFFSLSITDQMRVFPAVISTASIIAFFFLAKTLIKQSGEILFSTLVFATIPSAFDWLIMGGGITRSLGFLFGLLSIREIYLLFTTSENKRIFTAALFSSLTILSHPEAPIHIIGVAVVFFFILARNKYGIYKGLAVALLILLMTSLWWSQMVVIHGLTPFLSAVGTGGYQSFVDLVIFLKYNFSGEPYVTIISASAMLGFFYMLIKKEYLIPLSAIAIYFIEPRSASLYLSIPTALLAGIVLDKLFGHLFEHSSRPLINGSPQKNITLYEIFSKQSSRFVFIFLFTYFIMSSMDENYQNISGASYVSKGNLDAFTWINLNISENSTFAVITGRSPLIDPVGEWFPALTNMKSITTIQGTEWLENSRSFTKRNYELMDLQSCYYKDEACLRNWQRENRNEPDYLYINKFFGYPFPANNRIDFVPLLEFIRKSNEHRIIFENSDAAIITNK